MASQRNLYTFSSTNNYIYCPFVSGSQKSLIRLTHPCPHFDVIYLYVYILLNLGVHGSCLYVLFTFL